MAMKMKSIGDVIQEKNIVITGGDAFSASGFTQVPNAILKTPKLTSHAKLTYAMLLSYAWQNDHCFPGQERLAKDLGAGKRSVVRYIDELQTKGYIKVKKRGLGKPNLYEIRVDKVQ
ncbi:helix-turn-helix domain-containing protein [Sulfitobacter aestuariivivens]|uniref:Helix-turn-helix domain-containing protein n=1 Tax=Sulfitobacter aestuariivivens TaxID=2766981 RepID=A0A927HG13_9RHOB|nr:helix-turn-helix domain-containing protein [Sulfitobacter aestuariivivens]MBD3663790.1 helix-turn-helix domain-containing protein [Sulfitobacter aestuariivivens]